MSPIQKEYLLAESDSCISRPSYDVIDVKVLWYHELHCLMSEKSEPVASKVKDTVFGKVHMLETKLTLYPAVFRPVGSCHKCVVSWANSEPVAEASLFFALSAR